MTISLLHALGYEGENLVLAIVGAGGKTTSMFRIARQLEKPVVLSTTTHLGIEQADLADRHLILKDQPSVDQIFAGIGQREVVLLSGEKTSDGRVGSPGLDILNKIRFECIKREIPLIIEADGARTLPLKAPAEHEPVIPNWVQQVLVVAGMNGLGYPLDEKTVHRVDFFAHLSGLSRGEIITPDSLIQVLTHPNGGLKNIPPSATRALFLNQADDNFRLAQAKYIAEKCLPQYDTIATGCLLPEGSRFDSEIDAVYLPIASVILAAGGSHRMGHSKALISWRGETLVHRAVRLALMAHLDPVIVVAGQDFHAVQMELQGLKCQVVQNPNWAAGQSTSLKAGLEQVPESIGAVLFQVVDQPGLTVDLLQSIVELYRQTRASIIQPQAAGSRANPVLFDRRTFADLQKIEGDVGGRAIFSKYHPLGLPWHDAGILMDLDTPEDLEKLKDL